MGKPKLLILGAGFAGTTAAHLLKEKFDITVLEADDYPGGGCRTKFLSGHPYTFGPRIFFSYDDEVIKTLTGVIKIREFDTKTFTYVQQDGNFYNYPIQKSDLELMPDFNLIKNDLMFEGNNFTNQKSDNFEDYWLNAIGPTLYNKFVDKYSKKMWTIESNRNLSSNFEWVNRGTPIRDGDDRLYKDQYQGYPQAYDGYNEFFDKILCNVNFINNCKVLSFDWRLKKVLTTKGEFTSDIIVNTLPVDYLFKLTYGKLQYSGRKFIPFMLPTEFAMPPEMTWIHYSSDEPFTRITEFKKITNYRSPHTLLGMEVPDNNSRYYPVQSFSELARFEKYKEMFPKNFYSIGRHGSFKYKGIPDAIRDALDLKASIL
jgi:UDP-galactopyranose mutase